ENEGATIVFADSPYEHFAPIRFAIIEQVDEGQGRLTLRGRLGPFICTDDRSALDVRWSQRSDDERPGRHRFLVTDDNVGLKSPDSPQAADEAWRAAVDSLTTNPFFDTTTIIRVAGIEVGGRQVDSAGGLSVGDRAEVDLELRSPQSHDEPLTPILLSEPEGSMALTGNTQLPVNGMAKLAVDVVEPGPATVSLVLRDRTLSSTQVRFDVDVRAGGDRLATTGRVASAAVGDKMNAGSTAGGPIDVVRLARFLQRNADMSDEHWLQLLDDQLLSVAPTSAVLLAATAGHAAAIGRDDRVVTSLTAIDVPTPKQQVALLMAVVRLGRNDLVADLLATTDLSESDHFEHFLAALDTAPESTLNLVINQELERRYLGDHLRTRLIQAAWPRMNSVDLLCKAAEDVAYVDPDEGANLLLSRWPTPAQMPEKAIDLLLDWSARRDRLGPYVRARLARAAESDDNSALESAIASIGSVSSDDQPALRLEAGLRMARAEHVLAARTGLNLAVEGFQGALRHGDIDRALAALPELSAVGARLGPDERMTVEGLVTLAEQAVVESVELTRWERMRSSTRSEEMRDRTNGLRVIAVGGKPLVWMEELADQLGLSNHRWIETDKDKSARHDWADDLSERDIVLAVLPEIGHDSTSVKAKVLRKGAAFEIVRRNQMSVLDGIERALGSGRD
ncbi:MAG TPA: hypothetical protein VL068_01855, partial [Microthrixaceae bacterium]|nr:hypothetical protein [Microthrixaceae bacterium]